MSRVPSTPPPGEPAPLDGALPPSALAGLGERPFAVYVHVPFCSVRCGYCDFNTYTAEELGGPQAPTGASRATYAAAVVQELSLARRVLGTVDIPVSTVFLGGGTPTLLPAADLGSVLTAIRSEFGLIADAEVTTEANPDSVTPQGLARLRQAGFNRISFGMQSAVPHVLRTLDRTHDPARVPTAVAWAREAGFEEVSLDLIYGTPGESLADWSASIEAAVECEPDHISAYALIIEDGTALARQVRRGDVIAPDDDLMADMYEMADARLRAAGLQWYELSNWARRPQSACRHNELYWTGGDWWGAGPGAHSHVGGLRWWNVRHPAAYADRLAGGNSPAQARELLDDETRRIERILLELRLRAGLPVEVLTTHGRRVIPELSQQGLLVEEAGRIVLTLKGRLLADAVVRDLVD